MLLPFSQRFEGGYLAFNRREFVDFFAEHHVQVPLTKGDAVFFNPALYHGAGSNVSADIRRIANLLQISSPFGRAMESLDRTAMVRAVYPALRAMKAAGRPSANYSTPWWRPPRVTPFPPTSTATSRSALWPHPVRSTPCWPRWPTISPPNNSTSRYATKTIGECHDHTRRNRTGPHRRLPHRHAVRPRWCRRACRSPTSAPRSSRPSPPNTVQSLQIRWRRCCRRASTVSWSPAATPAHAELTLAAVQRGLPTFCEKPIAATAAESARVAEVIAQSGVPVQVGYQRRFDAAFAAAKRAVDDGSLGPLHTVRSTTMDPAPPPMEYIAGSGGIFRDCAVHDFDVLRWITGQRGRRGLRDRQRAGRPPDSPSTATSTPPQWW